NKLLKTRIKTDQKRLAEVVNSKNIEEAEKNFNILSKYLDHVLKLKSSS
ncbi:unnamed protein product, partial [marine sediment metagenome]